MSGKPTYGLNRWSWACIHCDHPVTTLTAVALDAAMEDHYRYVRHTADRAEDPHYEDERLDRLMAS